MTIESNLLGMPLEIRGHHLPRLVSLVCWKTEPGKYAESMVIMARKNKNPEYRMDLIGDTEEEAQRFLDKNTVVAKRFMELPDDYPVRIVFGKPDDICRTCAIGNHCQNEKIRHADWLESHNFFIQAGFMPTPNNGEIITLGQLKEAVREYNRKL